MLEQLKTVHETVLQTLPHDDKLTYREQRAAALLRQAFPVLLECASTLLAMGDAFDTGQAATPTSAIGKYRATRAKLETLK